jgi:hypothetical protein
MDKKVIAPYVRQLLLPDLETSIRVADAALVYFQSLHREYVTAPHPGACVGLALYQTELDTMERISCLAKLSGKTLEGFLKVLSETRTLLRLPFAMSFDELVAHAHLPVRLASTAKKIFSDLQAEFPGEAEVSRASICAAVLLVVAVKRGFNKAQTLASLAAITTSDPEDVGKSEIMIRNLIGQKYGLKTATRNTEPSDREAGEEVKRATELKMAEMKKEGAKPMIQGKLNFALASRREEGC